MHDTDDPHCPECGEPIGQTATYCMHCSADLTDERAAADADDDLTWDQAETGTEMTSATTGERASGGRSDQLLDPEGVVDDTLTVLVGIAGGIVVGVVGSVVLTVVTGSALAFAFGILTWLVATAYLVRRRTVQEAVAKSGYAVAVVLLSIPVIALSPLVDVQGGLRARGGLFVGLLFFAIIPAGIAAAVGWVASQFVPDSTDSDG